MPLPCSMPSLHHRLLLTPSIIIQCFFICRGGLSPASCLLSFLLSLLCISCTDHEHQPCLVTLSLLPPVSTLVVSHAAGEDLFPSGCPMFHQPLDFALMPLVALLPSPHLLSLLLNNYSDVIQCSYTQAEAFSVGERPY